jgi:CspA family cold shock protein
MATGTVKWFDHEKGYGFIDQDESKQDLFVHHSEVKGGNLNEGEKVSYEIGEGRKGPCAVGVEAL